MILYKRRLAVLGTVDGLTWVDTTGSMATVLVICRLDSLFLYKNRIGAYSYSEDFRLRPLCYRPT